MKGFILLAEFRLDQPYLLQEVVTTRLKASTYLFFRQIFPVPAPVASKRLTCT